MGSTAATLYAFDTTPEEDLVLLFWSDTRMLLVKTDSAGTPRWAYSYAPAQPGYGLLPQKARSLSDGRIAIVGMRPNLADDCPWIAVLDEDGNALWSRTVAGFWGHATDVLETADGGFLVVGNGRYVGFATKLSRDGTQEWLKVYVLDPYVYRASLTTGVCAGDGYLLVGTTSSSGSGSPFILRINAGGNVVWCSVYSCAGSYLGFGEIIANPDGGLVIGGGYQHLWSSHFHQLIAKLAPDGTPGWAVDVGYYNREIWHGGVVKAPTGYLLVGSMYMWKPTKSVATVLHVQADGAPPSCSVLTYYRSGFFQTTAVVPAVYSQEGGVYPVPLVRTAATIAVTHSDLVASRVCPETTLHVVPTPTPPSGPSSGLTGQALVFSVASPTACSQGHGLEYQFDWGDGSPFSPWGSNLEASHAYAATGDFSVRAQARCSVDTNVTSPWSAAKLVTITRATSPPSAPSGLFATQVEAFQVHLKWTDNSDNETQFVVVRNGYLKKILPPDLTVWTDYDVSPNTKYCYAVYAVNNAGASGATSEVCIRTPHGTSISVAYVTPERGEAGTLFSFVARFFDSRGRKPDVAYVYVNDKKLTMTHEKSEGDYRLYARRDVLCPLGWRAP